MFKVNCCTVPFGRVMLMITLFILTSNALTVILTPVPATTFPPVKFSGIIFKFEIEGFFKSVDQLNAVFEAYPVFPATSTAVTR